MAQAEGACPLATSRLELNLVRLLCRCESMAAEKRELNEWRLEKYVGALEDMLQALKVQASKPASEVISEYSRKVDFLKGMLQAEKLTSSSEKALANQFLAPGRVPTTARERVPATKTVHLQSRARYTSEMRSELLGMESSAAERRSPGLQMRSSQRLSWTSSSRGTRASRKSWLKRCSAWPAASRPTHWLPRVSSRRTTRPCHTHSRWPTRTWRS
ncbi:vesicle transport protein USE1 isoform X4 [Psammomys obesus]|uniref:vesicle transport protein USE1 isoform X4 n=1 Tax=Psammomys obesus TaxID=48139 RepID=UPI002452C98D|nr:vesicle transport protein USE1 isoform X4 [Psammomys obesus]